MTTDTETGTRTGARRGRRRRRPLVTAGVAVLAVVALAPARSCTRQNSKPHGPLTALPPSAGSYLGVYTKDLPASYNNVAAFKQATGTTPNIVMYYSGWYVPFPMAFADHRGQQRCGATDPDGPGPEGHRASARSLPANTTAT